MDEAAGPPIKLGLQPRFSSLGLSFLFYTALQVEIGSTFAIPLSLIYYVLINLAASPPKVTIDAGQDVSDSFLSSFANNLTTLGPEEAFSEALKGAPSPVLYPAISRLRDGFSLPEVLLSINTESRSEAALLASASRALAYGSREASNRLRKYLAYRQERRRIVSEYSGKMAVLSLRLRVLSAIAAASLAVIAYATPLLSSLSLASGLPHKTGLDWHLPAIAFFSASVLCPYLFARTVPNTDGGRLAAACAIVYIFVFMALFATIGWRL